MIMMMRTRGAIPSNSKASRKCRCCVAAHDISYSGFPATRMHTRARPLQGVPAECARALDGTGDRSQFRSQIVHAQAGFISELSCICPGAELGVSLLVNAHNCSEAGIAADQVLSTTALYQVWHKPKFCDVIGAIQEYCWLGA